MMNEKVKEVLSNFFGYLIVAFTCALYVLTTIFVLNPTGKTLGQIIGDGLLAFGIGITINRLMSMQGILNGMRTKVVGDTMVLFGKTVDKVSGVINKLDEWCYKKNLDTYKCQRTKILARAGLKYDDCFFEDGTAKPFVYTLQEHSYTVDEERLKNPLTRKAEKLRIKIASKNRSNAQKDAKFKNKCYLKAVRLKLTDLYASDLTSEGGKQGDPNYLGLTINEYLTVDSLKSIISKVLLAIAIGIYGIELISNFSWMNLIWRSFQIFIFLAFGLVKLRKSYMFVTNEYRGRIIKKIDRLEEFEADIKAETQSNDIAGGQENVNNREESKSV
jgi:hypothetical protein